MSSDSLLSDDLLRQLVAVGNVDLLVGVPTLNHAATISGIVRAVHDALRLYFPRQRAVVINSDGGSVDGTRELARNSSLEATGTVAASVETISVYGTDNATVPMSAALTLSALSGASAFQ